MSAKPATNDTMDKIVSLCKRRGYVYPSSEIYGGLGSCWDYGPLGAELKRNLKSFWWEAMTNRRDDIEGLDAAILMHPQVWVTSGHVAEFTDPLVDCKKCKARFRADKLAEARCPLKPSKSPLECGGELTEARKFNLMFKTFMGPVEDESAIVYMRPETAQGIYVNFLNVKNSSRQKIPFGIAQIGKAFRNEITPGNFIFRTREFEQMEMQFFIHPSEDEKWFEYWRQERWNWYKDLGIRMEKLRWHQHGEGELAHYAKAAYDIEYEYPFGWQELEGVHNRTDFDLSRHMQATNKDLRYFDERFPEKFVPYIIETSAGCDRTLLTILVDAYDEIEVKGETRVFLRLSPKVAPIKAAIFPLVNKEGMPEYAEKVYHDLKKKFKVFYDDSGAVGRRYARMDEAGCPFCITVDGQTLQDNTMTLRDRDSMEQTRLTATEIADFLTAKIGG
ncbi:glycine--tRNA ligase [candidate division GN15 bacterium]|uniref:Glycine--tRNA ligase n=1 Tax=candidate division GN15 bacterium TaxID=2072418 RepID=A0A855X0U1_9BACT|nr:MAG: glycine--tRNA ligase [candidate division GN15 bacterium]